MKVKSACQNIEFHMAGSGESLLLVMSHTLHGRRLIGYISDYPAGVPGDWVANSTAYTLDYIGWHSNI